MFTLGVVLVYSREAPRVRVWFLFTQGMHPGESHVIIGDEKVIFSQCEELRTDSGGGK